MNDPLKLLPGYALRRASAAMFADLAERLAPLDLRPTEVSVMKLIAANTGINQSALCQSLAMKRANMVPLTAKLEARGIISRTQTDGRSQGLALTAAGEALRLDAERAISAHETMLLARIPEAHRAHFLPALSALWG
jgi:DNA-binding MarR family transcriptional regulator